MRRSARAVEVVEEVVFTVVIFLIIRKIDLVVTTLLWEDGKSEYVEGG